MFVMDIRSLPAKLKVLSFAWIAGIAVVDVIPGEIESEVMGVQLRLVVTCVTRFALID